MIIVNVVLTYAAQFYFIFTQKTNYALMDKS